MMDINKNIKKFGPTTRRMIIAILILFFSKGSYAQELSVKQADSLLYVLKKQNTDSASFAVLIKLAAFQVSKLRGPKPVTDSAGIFIGQASRLLAKLHSVAATGSFYLVESNYYRKTGDDKLSQKALDKAIAYFKSAKDRSLLASAYEESYSRLELSKLNIPLKMRFLQLAEEEYSKTTNKRKQGDCLRLLADIRSTISNSDAIILELDSAKRLYQQARSGDWQQLYIIYCRHYIMQNDYKNALASILDALRSTDLKDTSMEVCELDYEAAALFIHLQDYKSSLTYAKHALLLAEKNNNTHEIYSTALYVVEDYSLLRTPRFALSLLNEISARYPVKKSDQPMQEYLIAKLIVSTDLKQISTGQVYFNEINELIKQKKIDDRSLNSILSLMIRFCVGAKQYAKAEILLDNWKDVIKRTGSTPYLRARMANSQLTVDTTRRSYKAAVNDLIRLKAINDSIFDETQTRQMKEMEVRYQTERKDVENNLQKQKILTLSEQQRVQRAELNTASVTRNITLISALCAIIIALLIYRQYVNGKKNNIVIAEKNKRLERLLAENEWLMKEVHHRVKNNLQIISSLLNSQSAYMENSAAVDAILKSKGRVESISLIHQKLYRSENQSSVYMPEYIQDLVRYLKDSFIEEQTIFFDLSIDPVSLDVSDAVPLGLIINESVTNAIKHAFGGNKDNVIDIKLRETETGVILTIRDNGKGFESRLTQENSSFGLLLINGLAEDLEGKLDISDDGGTVICLSFKPSSMLSAYQEEPTRG